MPIEESKQLIRRFYTEVVGGGDYSNLDGFVATDYVDHNAAEGSRGPEVVRTHLEAIRTTLPDFTIRIEDILAEGDYVIRRVAGRGTHLGEWMGIKPTGRESRYHRHVRADGRRSIRRLYGRMRRSPSLGHVGGLRLLFDLPQLPGEDWLGGTS